MQKRRLRVAGHVRRISRCRAVSRTEADRLLHANPFDLLVTDIRLPGIDGITLTALTRIWSKRLPVVWITAHGCAPIREDAARLGVHRCLDKPVEVSEFRQVVEQALAEGAPANT